MIQKVKRYNLVYVNGGKVVETVLRNESKALCKWKADKLKQLDNYKLGIFLIESVK